MWLLTTTVLATAIAIPPSAFLPGPAGPVAESDAEPLVKEMILDAPRDEVWLAWTTQEGLQGFFARNVNIDLRPGGSFELLLDHEAEEGLRGSEGCHVLSFVEGEMLSFTWNAPAEFLHERGERTFVVLQLADVDGDRTRVKLTHDGWRWKHGGKWGGVRAYFDAEWDRVFSNLEKFMADGPLWSPEELASARIEPVTLRHFLYFGAPREVAFESRTEEDEAIRGHQEHVLRQLARDRLVFAGPSLPEFVYPETPDARPLEMPWTAIFIIKARDLDEAREIMEGETMIARGFWEGCLQPFRMAIERPGYAEIQR